MSVAKSITVDRDFATTLAQTRQALAAEGFGIITEIDMQATMANKLDLEYDCFVILGACNPALAHRAIQAHPSVGTLLPCNVVVRRSGSSTVVEAVDPQLLVTTTDEAALAEVADDAGARLDRVLAAVASA